ncbi:MAG: hypothetical protein AB7O26_07305 [Planctomycetaceae bacterium]
MSRIIGTTSAENPPVDFCQRQIVKELSRRSSFLTLRDLRLALARIAFRVLPQGWQATAFLPRSPHAESLQ